MTEEFNLSEERESDLNWWFREYKGKQLRNSNMEELIKIIFKKDKEFIKRLKESLEKKWVKENGYTFTLNEIRTRIDKLAGDKLK